jgi:hypothetical protein
MSSESSASQIAPIENYKIDSTSNEENIDNDSIKISVSKDTMTMESTSNISYPSISTKRKLENSVLSESLYINSTSETNRSSISFENNDIIGSEQVCQYY